MLIDTIREMGVGDADTIALNFTDYLDDGETVATVDSAVCSQATGAGVVGDLTLTNRRVLPLVYREADTGDLVPIGNAGAFDISGQQANTIYYIDVAITTTAPRTKNITVRIWVA